MLEDIFCFIIKLVAICMIIFTIGTVFLLGAFIIGGMRWQVHEITPQVRAYYAEHEILPGLADTYERDATRGVQDVEGQRETYVYNSLEELCNAMPEVCAAAIRKALNESEPKDAKDIKGKKVKAYPVDPADLQVSIPDETNSHHHDSIYFYVFKYKNGKYRFVIRNYRL